MYSVVLLAAMSTPGDATAFGKKGGCYGGAACYGTVSYGCTGVASCYGCTGMGSCYGSTIVVGAGCHGASCYGAACYGAACYGSSCYGASCFGSSCYGGCGGKAKGGFLGLRGGKHSCHGGSSCYGSCFGSCYGGCQGSGVVVGAGCYGSGCYGVPGGGCGGVIVVPSTGGTEVKPEVKPKAETKPAGAASALPAAPMPEFGASRVD